MDWFKKYIAAPLASLFKEEADVTPEPEPMMYNDTLVKAGILHLRNLMSKNDAQHYKDDYDDVFRMVRLKPQMSEDDIEEQVGMLIDKMMETGLITEEEQARVDRETLLAHMTNAVINAMESYDSDENILNAIRFDQDLRRPKLHVVRNDSIDHE